MILKHLSLLTKHLHLSYKHLEKMYSLLDIFEWSGHYALEIFILDIIYNKKMTKISGFCLFVTTLNTLCVGAHPSLGSGHADLVL